MSNMDKEQGKELLLWRYSFLILCSFIRYIRLEFKTGMLNLHDAEILKNLLSDFTKHLNDIGMLLS